MVAFQQASRSFFEGGFDIVQETLPQMFLRLLKSRKYSSNIVEKTTTPPNVYGKIRQNLLVHSKESYCDDQKDAILKAKDALLQSKAVVEKEARDELHSGNGKWGAGFFKRLIRDGGNKVLIYSLLSIDIENIPKFSSC